jgi:hypothetical protein
MDDARNSIAQKKVNKARYAWKRDGRAMLYPKGSQNASTQRIQITT